MNEVPEVDYSRFAYKREGEKTGERATEKKPFPADYSVEYEVSSPTPFEKRSGKRKKRGGNVIFVLFVLFLCFALILLATDIISNGKIAATLTSALRKNDYEYYAVAVEKQDRSSAYSKSLTVKQGGGAGYVYIKDNRFYVLFSAYADMTEANNVAAKNTDSTVLVFGKKGKDSFYTEMDDLFKTFAETVTDYDEGLLTDSGFNGRKESIKTAVQKLSQDKKSNSSDKKALCSFVSDGLDALVVSEGTKSEFLSNARYFLAGWLVSLCA